MTCFRFFQSKSGGRGRKEEELRVVGICYDVKVLVQRPFFPTECDRADQTTRPAPGARFCSASSSTERKRERERSRYALTASHWDGDCRRRLLIRPIWYELLVLHPPTPPAAYSQPPYLSSYSIH